jgi:Domain of unknown function (DUF4389)
MATKSKAYPASFKIDYPKKFDRLSSFFRIVWALPIFVIYLLLSGAGITTYTDEAGKRITQSAGGIVTGLFAATALMILFRQRYPRWWFDFNLELNRFATRVEAYLFLLTDRYPSTEDQQTVHVYVEYPNVKKDLNKWLPLVKWLLAFPHYLVLLVLAIGAAIATIIAWFSILFTGKYPKGLFDYVVGVGRSAWRVTAYAILLTTDEYPPFSLK